MKERTERECRGHPDYGCMRGNGRTPWRRSCSMDGSDPVSRHLDYDAGSQAPVAETARLLRRMEELISDSQSAPIFVIVAHIADADETMGPVPLEAGATLRSALRTLNSRPRPLPVIARLP